MHSIPPGKIIIDVLIVTSQQFGKSLSLQPLLKMSVSKIFDCASKLRLCVFRMASIKQKQQKNPNGLAVQQQDWLYACQLRIGGKSF